MGGWPEEEQQPIEPPQEEIQTPAEEPCSPPWRPGGGYDDQKS
jgi:hypothetical protein